MRPKLILSCHHMTLLADCLFPKLHCLLFLQPMDADLIPLQKEQAHLLAYDILDAHGGDLYTSGPAAYLETVK